MRYPGIWPATFQFPDKDQQFWAPITTNRYWRDPALTTKIDPRNKRFFFGRWQTVGRLKDQGRFQQGLKRDNPQPLSYGEMSEVRRAMPRVALAPSGSV